MVVDQISIGAAEITASREVDCPLNKNNKKKKIFFLVKSRAATLIRRDVIDMKSGCSGELPNKRWLLLARLFDNISKFQHV